MSRGNYSVPVPDDQQTVICLHCEKALEVPRKTISVTCKYCHKPLRLQDEALKNYVARRTIETCGIVTIEKKANIIISDKVNCGGLIVRGKLKGDILSRGPVLVGPEAEIQGDVIAPTLAVGAGAILDGDYRIGKRATGVAT